MRLWCHGGEQVNPGLISLNQMQKQMRLKSCPLPVGGTLETLVNSQTETKKVKRKLETAGRHTFHRGGGRAWGGERVNSGEGPFARLIKGLDAERVRGRLIKPLDFVCVAWSFIQGYKSATAGA